jgi:capsular polysaccharide transport system permease protein
MPQQPNQTAKMDTFVRGLKVQAGCLNALMVREMMMRYGRDNLGFLWILIEPMLLCVGVMIMWSFIHAPFEHGITVVALVLTGYMPLTLWRHMTQMAAMTPFKRNADLLYHRHVSLLDVFLTRIFLEFAGTTAAFLLVSAVTIAFGLVDMPYDLGLILAGWTSLGALSAGVALITAILTESSEISEKFVPVFQYVTLPISGCFFMVDWLPSYAQELIWFNPPTHCYEMIRAGFFGGTVRTYFTPWYPLVWGIALFAIGIGFVNGTRDRLHA